MSCNHVNICIIYIAIYFIYHVYGVYVQLNTLMHKYRKIYTIYTNKVCSRDYTPYANIYINNAHAHCRKNLISYLDVTMRYRALFVFICLENIHARVCVCVCLEIKNTQTHNDCDNTEQSNAENYVRP